MHPTYGESPGSLIFLGECRFSCLPYLRGNLAINHKTLWRFLFNLKVVIDVVRPRRNRYAAVEFITFAIGYIARRP